MLSGAGAARDEHVKAVWTVLLMDLKAQVGDELEELEC
jgi:hypothetical protein